MNKKIKRPKPELGPNTSAFVDIIERTLECFNLEFEHYYPQFVLHEKHGWALLFCQVSVEDDPDLMPANSIVAVEDGLIFPGNCEIQIPYGIEYTYKDEGDGFQTPEQVAVLVAAAMIRKIPLIPPKCPSCEEALKREKKELEKIQKAYKPEDHFEKSSWAKHQDGETDDGTDDLDFNSKSSPCHY